MARRLPGTAALKVVAGEETGALESPSILATLAA